MTTISIVKPKDKLSLPSVTKEVPYPYKFFEDWELEQEYLWGGDPTRPWGIYSKEIFRKFWDIRVREKRKRGQ